LTSEAGLLFVNAAQYTVPAYLLLLSSCKVTVMVVLVVFEVELVISGALTDNVGNEVG
jgi:hypothetical protein